MSRPMCVAMLLLVLSGPMALAGEGGLVAYWALDEGDGTIVHDRSGLDSHGTIHGPRWVLCGRGYALRFDGVDDYVDCSNSKALDLRGPMTLAVWVWAGKKNPNEPGLVGKWLDSYALTLRDSQCRWYVAGEANCVHAPLTAGQWNHVAGTFDGRVLRLYIDGVERAHADSKAKAIPAGRDFTMGRLLPDPAAVAAARGLFAGMLDEVKVFDRPLSPAEIVAEYNRQAEEKGRTPVAEK